MKPTLPENSDIYFGVGWGLCSLPTVQLPLIFQAGDEWISMCKYEHTMTADWVRWRKMENRKKAAYLEIYANIPNLNLPRNPTDFKSNISQSK